MFEKWGRFSYAHRRLIPAIIVAAILALFIGFGMQLEDRMSQEGWEDPNAASTSAARSSRKHSAAITPAMLSCSSTPPMRTSTPPSSTWRS